MSDFPLLPSDKYIADLLGLTPEQYRYYIAEVRRRAAEGPQPSAVATIGPDWAIYVAIISSLISVGLTIAASFFKPSQQTPGQLVSNQIQGNTINNARRFAPRIGYDSVQDSASIGDPIPLVYAKRELIDGRYYGGLRVNAPLLWSQIRSINKSQLLRAIFLIGEGGINSIDPANIAIGNNTLGSYLTGDTSRARFSVYYRPDGGRLTAGDHLVGADPQYDAGNALDADVFGLPDLATSTVTSDFCHSRRPNTQTVFGVYSLIGNGLGMRVNPSLRPAVNAQVTADVDSAGGKKSGGSAKARVVCERDFVALAQREKHKARFSSRSGLVHALDSTWRYRLSATSDVLTTFEAGSDSFSWKGRAAVAYNPFPPYDSPYGQDPITNDELEQLIEVSDITTSGSSIEGTVTFDEDKAKSMLKFMDEGTYVIDYYIWFEYDTGKQVAFEHKVTVSIEESSNFNYENLVYKKTFEFSNISATYTGTYSKNEAHEEKCGDVASTVAGRQKTWDDALLVGELYKIGSALAVCTQRQAVLSAEQLADGFSSYAEGVFPVGPNRNHIETNSGTFYATEEKNFYAIAGDINLSDFDAIFNSDADFDPPEGGTTVDVLFQVVRPGVTAAIPEEELTRSAKESPPFFTATQQPHLFRVALATFSTVRECRAVEIGFRSVLGIRIGGLCNFKDALTFEEIDYKACLSKKDDELNPGDTIAVDIFQSGQLNSFEERYSFFRIRYREADTNASFVEFPQCFGVRGITQQAIFNSIQISMPAVRRWEFQFEPLTGWEIRSGQASGDLEVIDTSLKTVRVIQYNGITITFNGVANYSRSFLPESARTLLGPQVFELTSVQRPTEVGIGYTDGDSYIDSWGKLAEAFVYEEVRSSAESSPEHEIVYINEIIPNPQTPYYDNLAILGLSMRASLEWQQLGQLSVYVTSGLKDTHLLPDIILDAFTDERYGAGDLVTDQQFNLDSFAAARAWCQNRRMFYDGVVVGRNNLRQWAADAAGSNLLFFGESEGRFWLRPAWPGTVASPEPVTIQGIFTAGNILKNSFAMEYLAPEERRPIKVSVKYREERFSTDLNNPGLFPVEKEVLVREAPPLSTDTDRIESIDLSGHVTSKEHAIDAGKFIARMRRIPDHAVRFSTTHEGVVANLHPGDYIRVALDITHFDELRNGAVLGNGTLVSTQPLPDGQYNVFAWNGSAESDPAPVPLIVSNEGTEAVPTGIIFTVITSEVLTRTYQIERITPNEDGSYAVEAMHMPTDENNILLLAKGFDDPVNWIIEG